MRRILSLLLVLLSAWPAHAAPAPLEGRYLYHFAWNGLALGSLQLLVTEGNGRYQLRSEVQAKGLVKLFSKHISHTSVTGNIAAAYRPLRYESLYQSKEKKKHVTLLYAEDGALLQETRLPLDAGKDRTPLTAEDKTGKLDPLTALVQARLLVAESKADAVSFTMYDGTRLAEARMTRGSTQSIAIGGENVPVSHWVVTRRPIGGYTSKELKKIKKEPPLNLYFAKDGSWLPLRMEVALPMGTVTGFLVGQCSSQVTCPAITDWDTARAEWAKALGQP